MKQQQSVDLPTIGAGARRSLASDGQIWLGLLYLTMVQKCYAFGKDHTWNFEFGSLPVLESWKQQGAQLPVGPQYLKLQKTPLLS